MKINITKHIDYQPLTVCLQMSYTDLSNDVSADVKKKDVSTDVKKKDVSADVVLRS
jgi:hypothetical protein